MDYGFSEQQQMFRKSIRDFMEAENPPSLVKQIENDKLDYAADLYRKMGDLGLLGLAIPEEYGGGGDFMDLAIFYEEAGRVLLQSPHLSSVVLCGQTILALGSDEQKHRLLRDIASGKKVAAFALSEPNTTFSLPLLTTVATDTGNEYTIKGTKLFIPYAHVADVIIPVCHADQEGKVITLIVDRESKGLTCIPMETLGGVRICEVVFDNVKVSKNNALGKPSKDSSKITGILDIAKLMSCIEMVGSAQSALDMLIEFSKQRITFGQPLGSFQAIQHKIADMALAVDGARWLAYYTVWKANENIPYKQDLAMTELQAGAVCVSVSTEVMHLHGAVGISIDHNAPLFYRRAKAAQLNLDRREALLEVIVGELGL